MRGDRTDEHRYADVTGWWRQPDLLRDLGPTLARLFQDVQPTVVLGPESRGCLLGSRVALSMRVGFIEVRKDRATSGDRDAWLRRTTPPDYRDRHLTLGSRRNPLDSRDRVLLVDDWIDTGGQALGTYLLTHDAKATWLGVATVVDALSSNECRPRVKTALTQRDSSSTECPLTGAYQRALRSPLAKCPLQQMSMRRRGYDDPSAASAVRDGQQGIAGFHQAVLITSWPRLVSMSW